MKSSRSLVLSRRQFVTRVMPACALACMAGGRIPAFGQSDETSEPADVHMFDLDSGRKLTNRQLMNYRYGEFIQLAKALKPEMGEDRLIELLKKTTTERMRSYGERQAKNSPDNNFEAYVSMFRGPDSYRNLLAMEVVEDTDRVFELKVTECIWATTFLAAGAGDIGYASVCFGDYAWSQGFNPKIRMVRDKTLMQGHACCNHRYLWEG